MEKEYLFKLEAKATDLDTLAARLREVAEKLGEGISQSTTFGFEENSHFTATLDVKENLKKD